MNGVDNFARRIFPVVAMALLVLIGLPEVGHGQTKGVEPQAEKLLRLTRLLYPDWDRGAE